MRAIRMIRQVDMTDCGPAALAMILSYWGRLEPLHRLRELAGTTQAGTSFFGLLRAAQKLGMDAKGLGANLDGLKELSLPAILHWEGNHFVVLERLAENGASIADPAEGRRWIKLSELEAKWTGKVLWLKTDVGFEQGTFVGKRGLAGLFAHLQHYRGSGPVLVELAIGTMLLGLLSLASPLVSQVLFDRVLTFREATLLPAILAAILVFSSFQALFGAVRGLLSADLTVRLNYRLSLGYLDHLLRLPLRAHETRLTGDLLTRFGDLEHVREVLSSLMVQVPATLFSLAFSLGLLFTYNPKLALVALINVPLELVYLFWLSPRLRRNSLNARRKEGEVQSALLSNLEGLWALKSFRAEAWALHKTRNTVAAFTDLTWRGAMLENTSRMIFGVLGGVGSLGVLWYGASQVLALELTVGQLVAAYGLMQGTMTAISSLTETLTKTQEGIVASDRLAEMLELKPEAKVNTWMPLPQLRDGLKVESLRFGYLAERPILRNISFELPKGTYSVLFGANGSGKSTLAALLTRLLEPDSGRVLWDELNLADVPLEALRDCMLYQRQEVPLFYASLYENLAVGREIEESRFEEVLEALGFANVIRRLPEGLETVIGGESPYRLSTGERQMLGLARALLSNNELLILDEPTATLDPDRERAVVRYLESLKGARTLLVITHRPALAEPADQVFMLESGELRQIESDAQRLLELEATKMLELERELEPS
jgi:ABC-type bacteriocin/lantibiotic exporter with double-glycine peptidase domain